jgi:phage gp29-like protein
VRETELFMPQLVDQFGRPIDARAIREPQTANSAMLSALEGEFDRHPAKGLTPARVNTIMQAAEQGDLIAQLELADDMEERDGQIFSELNKRKLALLKLDWDVLPPENASAAEKAQAEQVKEWLQAIPDFKRRVLFNMVDAILKGFSAIEMWWELQDGYLQPRFEFRPQRWFTLNQQRNRITLRNNAMQYGEPLQPFNWLLHLHPARNGYLARQALSRVLMLPYLYKNYSTRDFAEFLEIYGLPLRLGKYPAGASDEEKQRLLQAVVGIGHNAAGIIPMGTEIDFEAATAGVDVPFLTMMERMDAIQSKVIVGQTLTSGEGQHGTQALGTVHNEVRLDIMAADAELLNGTLTSQLVAPMALLNIAGADPRRLPRFCLQVDEPEDVKAFADSMPALAGSGMRIGVAWAHEKLRIPEAGENEEILTGKTAAPADPAGGVPPGGDPAAGGGAKPPAKTPAPAKDNQAALSAQLAGQPPRDAIDALVDEATADWQPLLAPMVEPVLAALDAAIARGDSLAMFREQLPALVDRMDATPMGDRLARAAFIARLFGDAGLNPDGTSIAGR